MFPLKKLLVLFIIFILQLSATLFSQTDSSSGKAQIDKVLSIVKQVTDEGNYSNELNQGNIEDARKLPIGIVKQIGAVRYIIAVDSVHYKEKKSCFNAYAAIDFPGTTTKIAFAASNIQFNPKGVIGGAQAKLKLVSDITFKINNTVSLQLKNDGSNYVEWDCNGFKAINLKGYFVFEKSKLKPDSSITKEKSVTASFEIHTDDIHNFVTEVSITPFVVEGLNSWSFKVDNATVDMSELSNSPSMVFPIGYNNPNMITPVMWTGFYLKSLKVKLPSEISKTGKRTEVNVNNLLIDHMGISGLFKVNNVFTTDEGNMSGWKFSINELSVGFICNELTSGQIKGEVNLPVMKENETMLYDASVSYNPSDKDIDYCFKVSPGSGFEFNVFSAKVSLNNTSRITIEKTKHVFKPSAVLNGLIEFTSSKMSTDGSQLTFQDLTITTQAPYLINGVLTLHTNGNQSKAAKYPASINDFSFGLDNGAPVIGFSVTVNLTEDSEKGFGGGVLVKIKGKIESEIVSFQDEVPVYYNKTKWKLDKVIIGGISINAETAPCKIKGMIIFRENDPVYGDGFFGKVELKIEKVIPNPISITSCFGVKDNYRYFYVDAAVPVNIPLGNIPITLNKLMGGLYYHMKPQNVSQTELINASKNQSATQTNALTYIPDNSISIGFKAGVGFKYTPSARTANGDVMLEIAFTSSGGLSFVKLAGDVYIMAEPSQREKAPIIGNIVVQYDAENKVFDANAAITINAYNAVTGKGSTKIHIEPSLWYVCAGKPSTPNYINVLNLVKATSYFMVGNSIEPALSPPAEVIAIINNGAQTPKRSEDELSKGSGFCTGARIVSDIHKKFGYKDFSVQGDYNFSLGFDMMMMNYGANGYCAGTNDKIGMNGWLAEGAMYITMSGSVKINGTCPVPTICYKEMDGPPYPCGTIKSPKICRDNISVPYPCMQNQTFDKPVFSAAVAAMVQGKLPKPLYFRGDFACQYDVMGVIKGDFNFDYEYGTDCSPVKSL